LKRYVVLTKQFSKVFDKYGKNIKQESIIYAVHKTASLQYAILVSV